MFPSSVSPKDVFFAGLPGQDIEMKVIPYDPLTKLRIEIQDDSDFTSCRPLEELRAYFEDFLQNVKSSHILKLKKLAETLGEQRLARREYQETIIQYLFIVIRGLKCQNVFIKELSKVFNFQEWDDTFISIMVSRVLKKTIETDLLLTYLDYWSKLTNYPKDELYLDLAPQIYGTDIYYQIVVNIHKMAAGKEFTDDMVSCFTQFLDTKMVNFSYANVFILELNEKCIGSNEQWLALYEAVLKKKHEVVAVVDLLPFLIFHLGILGTDFVISFEIFENKFIFDIQSDSLVGILSKDMTESVQEILFILAKLAQEAPTNMQKSNILGVYLCTVLFYTDYYDLDEILKLLKNIKPILKICNIGMQVKKILFGIMVGCFSKDTNTDIWAEDGVLAHLKDLDLLDESFLDVVFANGNLSLVEFNGKYKSSSAYIEAISLLLKITESKAAAKMLFNHKWTSGNDILVNAATQIFLKHGIPEDVRKILKSTIIKMKTDWYNRTILIELLQAFPTTPFDFQRYLQYVLRLEVDQESSLTILDYLCNKDFVFSKVEFAKDHQALVRAVSGKLFLVSPNSLELFMQAVSYQKKLISEYFPNNTEVTVEASLNLIMAFAALYNKSGRVQRGPVRVQCYQMIAEAYEIIVDSGSKLVFEADTYIKEFLIKHHEHQGPILVREGKKLVVKSCAESHFFPDYLKSLPQTLSYHECRLLMNYLLKTEFTFNKSEFASQNPELLCGVIEKIASVRRRYFVPSDEFTWEKLSEFLHFMEMEKKVLGEYFPAENKIILRVGLSWIKSLMKCSTIGSGVRIMLYPLVVEMYNTLVDSKSSLVTQADKYIDEYSIFEDEYPWIGRENNKLVLINRSDMMDL